MSDTSVRREVTLAVRPAEAFDVFTTRFDAVKPPEHNILGVPAVESVLEPYVGGRLVDRAPDGRECRWGRVLAFDPPERLVFSWEIGPDWQLVTDPATADVRLSTPRRVSIVGIAVGQTDASFYDSLGRCTLVVDIRVEQDVSAAADLVRRLLPGSNVQIQAAGQSIILSGSVESAADRDKVAQIAAQYVARPDQVLNWIATADSD